MKKYAIIMIIGAVVIAMTMSASADENRPELRTEEIDQEDLIISPAPTSEELIIAPNPDTVVEHDAEEGERTIDETIIAPDPYDGDIEKEILENDEIVDSSSAYGAVSSDSKSSKYGVGAQVFLVIGAVIVLLVAFLVLRKNK